MKTTKSLLLAMSLFLATSLSFLSFGIERLSVFDEGEILIEQRNDDLVGLPRSQAHNPFTAFLDGTDVELYSADATYGTVGVYLFSTAGDLVSTYFDTTTGSITIPISGLSGSYTIIITTSDGLVFEGAFSL